jgi:hypothetical protein
VRDPTPHEVPDPQWVVRRRPYEGMLVVELEDFHGPGNVAELAVLHKKRNRQSLVERDVASTNAKNREIGLGSGRDGSPDLEGVAEAEGGVCGPANRAQGREAVIASRVVCHVTPAPKNEAEPIMKDRYQCGTNHINDSIEEGGATGAHDHFVQGSEGAGSMEIFRQACQVGEEGIHRAQGHLEAPWLHHAFEAFDPRENQAGRSANGFGDLLRLLR